MSLNADISRGSEGLEFPVIYFMQIFCQKLPIFWIPYFFLDVGSQNKLGMLLNFCLINFRMQLNCGMSSRLLIHDSFI